MASIPHLQEDTIFQKKTWTYRIPALLYLAQSRTVLAFAEEREDEVDEHAKRLVLRRGMYDKTATCVQWRDVETLVTAQLEGQRSMNPSPVYDEVTQTVFLFFVTIPGKVSEDHQINTKTNLVRLCYITSRDEGQTWSPLTDITESVIGTEYGKWATFAVGPGHCLQLHNDARSLLIPAYAYSIHSPDTPAVPYAFSIISSDHGKTWKLGKFVAKESAVECQLVEVNKEGETRLYCNARSNKRVRVEAVSQTYGMDFQEVRQADRLVEEPRGCHGSIIGFSNPMKALMGSTETWVLFSHPTDSCGRRDLGLYLNKNPLEPEHWEEPKIIYPGPSAYSDLQYLGPGPDGSPCFCCLFECGTCSEYECIKFLMFTLQQVFPSMY
ncbi:sialidase-2 [Rhinatrema bivittatum]|uniref:sialidase-2 n=1 Tax=Rhinatrema bivittatum TaxID=194408 RepID=UPI00112722E3|nr:sialidase-2 [Rhinatrema bivittatum]XP_029472578.1 sialidase-2 [Rhinatrema bivittatum]XP_029472580.1 sialidase-2 [Rhinatrema bivittatum]XP_029472581.1 sialidase-2 [Rhinatrema bivittatum]XP_029472582.1 sialidase-2 [Rhinatrema bivittatum]XP_029472583.1 sialidase-2 [Rhinatrema bivittatum]